MVCGLGCCLSWVPGPLRSQGSQQRGLRLVAGVEKLLEGF